jgi:ATP/maltotriose-dependent transcriptional regulator MalT/transcriptional regulator with XRE-family HTH domain
MPNPQRLYRLIELREARGFTLADMAAYCGLPGRRGRESVSKWEQGESIPRASRRSKFIAYLRDGLTLDSAALRQVWDILVEEWAWEPLSEAELRGTFSDLGKESAPRYQTALEPAGEFRRAVSVSAEQMPETFYLSLTPHPATEVALPFSFAPSQPPLYDLNHLYPAKPFEIPPPPRPTRPPEGLGFVGREAELVYYAEKLNRSHLVVINGMAGVGKTALAAVLARQEAKLGKIFWHSFHAREGVQAIVWSLAGFLAWHGQAELWRLLQSAQLTGGEAPPPETLFDYLYELMHGRNYLLCFDDFHLVEDDLLVHKLVKRLKTAIAAGELAIIMTTRRRPDFALTTDVAPLSGLNLADTRHLLGRYDLFLPEEQISELHRITAGNAQLLILAIEILRRADDPARLIQRLADVDDIERYLMAEVDEGLSGAEQAVMGAVAVLMGYPGPREAIEAILNQGNVWRSLRYLTDRHLLMVNEGEAGKEYRQQAMVQAFYYHLLSQPQRRTLHRRAAEYYQNEPSDRLKAGLHFERAGDYKEAARVTTADVLGLINRGQAPQLGELLKHFKASQLEITQWIEVKLALGWVSRLLGEVAAARASYDEALAQAATLPDSAAARELKARACGGIADLLRLEKPQEALAWLRQGLQAIAELDSAEHAALLIQVGDIQMTLGNYDEALGALKEGLAHLPEGPSRRRGEALKNLGAVYSAQGDISRAKWVARQALEVSRQLHDSFQETFILSNLGIDKYISGDWVSAMEDFQQALRLAERIGSVEQKTMLNLNLGAAFIYLGEDKRARTHLLDSLELARQNNLQMFEVLSQYRLADLEIRQEKWAEAAVSLAQAEQLALAIEAEGNLPEIYGAWAEICLATGQYERAWEYAQHSLDIAGKLGENLELGVSLRILGQVYIADEDYPGAQQAFEKSLSLLEAQDPYETARTKMQWGLAILSGGDTDVSKGGRLLQEAQQLFRELGAKRDLMAVERLLTYYQGR